jgi:hypothetical protein
VLARGRQHIGNKNTPINQGVGSIGWNDLCVYCDVNNIMTLMYRGEVIPSSSFDVIVVTPNVVQGVLCGLALMLQLSLNRRLYIQYTRNNAIYYT